MQLSGKSIREKLIFSMVSYYTVGSARQEFYDFLESISKTSGKSQGFFFWRSASQRKDLCLSRFLGIAPRKSVHDADLITASPALLIDGQLGPDFSPLWG